MIVQNCNFNGIEKWVYDQQHLGIITTDIELNVTFINSWIEDFLNLKATNVCGNNIYEIFPELSQKNIPSKLTQALSGQVTVLSHRFHKYILPIKLSKSENLHFDLMQQSATISPKSNEKGVEGVIIVIENVTDRVSREQDLSNRIEELERIQKSLLSSEKALKESVSLNQSLLQTIPFGMDIVDQNGNILFQSESFRKIFGEKARNKKCWELYRDDKKQCSDCPLKKEIEIGLTEIYIACEVFGGKTYEVTHTGMIYKGQKALLEIFIDITERKLAEETIKESEAMFRQLNLASTEILQLPDLQSVYRYLNQTLHNQFPETVSIFISIDEANKTTQLLDIAGTDNKMFNKAQNLLGFNLINSKYPLHPDLKPYLRSGNLSLFKGGLVEFTFNQFPKLVTKSIEKLLNISNIYTIGINREQELLGAIHFFTFNNKELKNSKYIELFVKQAAVFIQKRQFEFELNQREEKFRTIFEQAPLGVALIDSYLGIIYDLNERFAKITGRSAKELRNIDWMSITHPDDIQEDLDNMSKLNLGLTNGFSMEKRYIKTDGTHVWINLTVAKVATKAGESPRHLAMIEDITERKESLIQLEKYSNDLRLTNSEKDKFFSIIAHDLRGPLGAFLGLTEYISENIESISNTALQEITMSLKNSASKLYNLLENLLEWSRMKRGMIEYNPENQNLHDSVGKIISDLEYVAKRKQISINNLIQKNKIVHADVNMLNTILRNLIANSVKFTNNEGFVNISASNSIDGYTQILVSDTGIGMKEEILENLFRIDVNVSRPGTNDEPSTGLGLLLCKEFVEKHDGKIWAESEVGKGSKFFFTMQSAK